MMRPSVSASTNGWVWVSGLFQLERSSVVLGVRRSIEDVGELLGDANEEV